MSLSAQEEKLIDVCEQLKDEAIACTQDLVHQPSIVGQEYLAQNVMARRLTELGFKIDRWEPDKAELQRHPACQDVPEDYNGRPIVVGTLPGQGGGRSIILNGHVDVVPPGPVEKWQHAPYSGLVLGDEIYGRGTTDMKAGLAMFLVAIEALRTAGLKPKGDIIFQSVIDEERGGNGTLACGLRGYRADAAIVGEPTNLDIAVANAGALWFRVTTPGKAAHGAYKYHGVSAVDKTVGILAALASLEQRWRLRATDPRFQMYDNPVPINVGSFHAGTWPSSVPDSAVIEGRIGYLPDCTAAEIKQEFETAVRAAGVGDEWLTAHPAKVEWFGLFMESAGTDPGEPIVTVARDAAAKVLGRDVALYGKAGGTDMRLLSTLGIPTIQLGPGLSSRCHVIDETVSIPNLMECIKITALTLARWTC